MYPARESNLQTKLRLEIGMVATTICERLNTDKLDGKHSFSFCEAKGMEPNDDDWFFYLGKFGIDSQRSITAMFCLKLRGSEFNFCCLPAIESNGMIQQHLHCEYKFGSHADSKPSDIKWAPYNWNGNAFLMGLNSESIFLPKSKLFSMPVDEASYNEIISMVYEFLHQLEIDMVKAKMFHKVHS